MNGGDWNWSSVGVIFNDICKPNRVGDEFANPRSVSRVVVDHPRVSHR